MTVTALHPKLPLFSAIGSGISFVVQKAGQLMRLGLTITGTTLAGMFIISIFLGPIVMESQAGAAFGEAITALGMSIIEVAGWAALALLVRSSELVAGISELRDLTIPEATEVWIRHIGMGGQRSNEQRTDSEHGIPEHLQNTGNHGWSDSDVSSSSPNASASEALPRNVFRLSQVLKLEVHPKDEL